MMVVTQPSCQWWRRGGQWQVYPGGRPAWPWEGAGPRQSASGCLCRRGGRRRRQPRTGWSGSDHWGWPRHRSAGTCSRRTGTRNCPVRWGRYFKKDQNDTPGFYIEFYQSFRDSLKLWQKITITSRLLACLVLINYVEEKNIYLDRFHSVLHKEKGLELEKDVVKLGEEGVGERRDFVSWKSDINIQELLETEKYFISPFKIKCADFSKNTFLPSLNHCLAVSQVIQSQIWDKNPRRDNSQKINMAKINLLGPICWACLLSLALTLKGWPSLVLLTAASTDL